MPQTLRVSRREIKFRCDLATLERLNISVGAFMAPDPHTKVDGYRVRSLYFDSLYDCDFHEARDGIEHRKKIRLRLYSPHDDKVKLELKRKENINQYKYSLTISRMDALEMISGNLDALLRYNDEEARNIHLMMVRGGYRPKCIVEYVRRAYTAEPNHIRITLDSQISTSRDVRLFAEKIPLRPVLPCDQGVLEVKYNGFLFAHVRQLLRQCDRLPTANSKYVLSRTVY